MISVSELQKIIDTKDQKAINDWESLIDSEIQSNLKLIFEIDVGEFPNQRIKDKLTAMYAGGGWNLVFNEDKENFWIYLSPIE